jgi:hypothetical protein
MQDATRDDNFGDTQSLPWWAAAEAAKRSPQSFVITRCG